MDGLNQYGIGRGYMSRSFVYPIDPPTFGFSDGNVAWMLQTAPDQEKCHGPVIVI